MVLGLRWGACGVGVFRVLSVLFWIGFCCLSVDCGAYSLRCFLVEFWFLGFVIRVFWLLSGIGILVYEWFGWCLGLVWRSGFPVRLVL